MDGTQKRQTIKEENLNWILSKLKILLNQKIPVKNMNRQISIWENICSNT